LCKQGIGGGSGSADVAIDKKVDRCRTGVFMSENPPANGVQKARILELNAGLCCKKILKTLSLKVFKTESLIGGDAASRPLLLPKKKIFSPLPQIFDLSLFLRAISD
jgi:hypothetical protein